ncbi:hypothetical protein [Spirosoma sp. KNUC1025]|uniref:hypothetical protein n=1 Tax=Spirosoma sp. KNUC1025 TaxID=2894082 RepID=UPI00386B2AF4|nr:hypothetical protein LN737_24775 [Spirosoma sp. KNUC1025]
MSAYQPTQLPYSFRNQLLRLVVVLLIIFVLIVAVGSTGYFFSAFLTTLFETVNRMGLEL